MRLVCPNCEAKYEVPDDAIPDTGRDVQCTNCGHSWFQMRGRTGASPFVAPAPIAPAAPVAEPVAEPVTTPVSSDMEAAAAALIDQPKAVEPEVVPEAVEETVAEAVRPVSVPLEEYRVAAPEGDAIPEAAKVKTVARHDAEAVADTAPVIDPEPVLENATEPVVETVASPVASGESDPVPEPIASAEVMAEAEALMPVEADSADMATAEATTEAIADPAPEAIPETASEATADDIPASAPDYAVDDSVLAILREEAEREANARRAEALESQTDLGIDAAMPRKVAAIAEAEAKPTARRDLLPDVEEINSTLRPSEMQADADGTADFVAPPPEAPRGFRSGFLSLMTVAILAAALYVVAPRLAVMVPALAGPLEGYIAIVDSLRLGLDGIMRSATVAISDG